MAGGGGLRGKEGSMHGRGHAWRGGGVRAGETATVAGLLECIPLRQFFR